MADPKKDRPVTRPLPKLGEKDTGPFWAATKDHELKFQTCDDCNEVVFHPRRHCTGCLGSNLSWSTSKGEATLYTYSIIRQSYHPFFKERVPFAVAWVDLDEGPRLLTNITGVEDPTSLVIGQRLVVEWEDYEELSIPLFRPL